MPRNNLINNKTYRIKQKGGDGYIKERENEFDKYNYRVVPNTWRELVQTRKPYDTTEIKSPLVQDILAGKTIFVDYFVPIERTASNTPFRTLYAYCKSRGYKLQIHLCDDVAAGKYRRVLMWCEPLNRVQIAKSEGTAA